MTRKMTIVRMVLTVMLLASVKGYADVSFIVPSTEIPEAGEVVVGLGKGINLFEVEIGMLGIGSIGLSMYGGVFKIKITEEDKDKWYHPNVQLVYSNMGNLSFESPLGFQLNIDRFSTFNLSASKTVKDSLISIGVLAGSCEFSVSTSEGNKEGIAIDPFVSMTIPAPSGIGKIVFEVIGCISGFSEDTFTGWYNPDDKYKGLILFPPFIKGEASGMIGLSQDYNLRDWGKLEFGGGVSFSLNKMMKQNALVLSVKLKFKLF